MQNNIYIYIYILKLTYNIQHSVAQSIKTTNGWVSLHTTLDLCAVYHLHHLLFLRALVPPPPSSCLLHHPPPPVSFLSPSLSKWVSSGVLAGRNHLRANTLLSVVKASPQIPFYTHKCHFPFVCTRAALAAPGWPRASSQTHQAEENVECGKALVLHSCLINTFDSTGADVRPIKGNEAQLSALSCCKHNL